MLYLFNNLEKLQAQVAKFKVKNPAGAVYKFDADKFALEREKLEELLASSDSLFGGQNLIVLHEIEELDLEKEAKIELLEKLKNSATKVLCFEREVKKSGVDKTGFNIFAITDALGERDRGELWLASQQAHKAGISSEEIFWKLVWQVKNMLLVAQMGVVAGKVTSLKPFVLEKSKKASQNYTVTELANLSSHLVQVWHETKRHTGRDFSLELEHLMLKI